MKCYCKLRTETGYEKFQCVFQNGKNLFVEYQSLLRRNGLKRLAERNEKVCVKHVVIDSRPVMLRSKKESDLVLSNNDLQKEFIRFFKHAEKLSVSLQFVHAAAFDEMSCANKYGMIRGKRLDESDIIKRTKFHKLENKGSDMPSVSTPGIRCLPPSAGLSKLSGRRKKGILLQIALDQVKNDTA